MSPKDILADLPFIREVLSVGSGRHLNSNRIMPNQLLALRPLDSLTCNSSLDVRLATDDAKHSNIFLWGLQVSPSNISSFYYQSR